MAALPPLSVTGGDAAPSGSGAGTGSIQVGGLTINRKPNYLLVVGLSAAVAIIVYRLTK